MASTELQSGQWGFGCGLTGSVHFVIAKLQTDCTNLEMKAVAAAGFGI